MTSPSLAEVRTRVQQNFRLVEQVAVEREFAARLIADAPAGPAPGGIVAAVGHLEAELAKTNTVGVIHASAAVAAAAAQANLIITNGGTARTPLGHLWAFGGGYIEGLGRALVATSPTYGWRDTVAVRDTFAPTENEYLAIAERSVVVGYERAVATAPGSPEPQIFPLCQSGGAYSHHGRHLDQPRPTRAACRCRDIRRIWSTSERRRNCAHLRV